MADISTGRQRGIVPFVDETTGRLPDQYLPQGVIDLQGDLEQAVTEASASATAAQQAVDGFGLEAGTTTTGEPGTDAAVEIQKNGNKYTANFTIPRGDKGEQTPVVHDATLTGDGTSVSPLGVVSGTVINPVDNQWNAIDFNDFTENGVYTFNGDPTNGPNVTPRWITGTLIVSRSFQRTAQLCLYYPNDNNKESFAFRSGDNNSIPNITWGKWHQIAFLDDLPDATALANEKGDIASLSTRVQALEARIKSLGTN